MSHKKCFCRERIIKNILHPQCASRQNSFVSVEQRILDAIDNDYHNNFALDVSWYCIKSVRCIFRWPHTSSKATINIAFSRFQKQLISLALYCVKLFQELSEVKQHFFQRGHRYRNYNSHFSCIRSSTLRYRKELIIGIIIIIKNHKINRKQKYKHLLFNLLDKHKDRC